MIFAIIGALSALVFGPFVRFVLDKAASNYERPEIVPNDDWIKLVRDVDRLLSPGKYSGRLLGRLERLLYFVAWWQEAYFLIPGWLAVKVATKWQVWTVMFENMGVVSWDPPQRLHARRYPLWRVSQTFLIGTVLNVLLAFVSYALAKWILSEVLTSDVSTTLGY